jgi:hypothetical protein
MQRMSGTFILKHFLVAMLKSFHKLGYKNIIASDIDDLRTADILMHLMIETAELFLYNNTRYGFIPNSYFELKG